MEVSCLDRPNIIMLISHDTGRQLGCYGKKVNTPHIDQLADEGIRFDEYYCSAPQCSPSRGSILTGLYPHNHGMMGLGHLGFSMKDGIQTLPQLMTNAGYETTLIGLNHEAIRGQDYLNSAKNGLGYQRVEVVQGNRASKVVEKVEDYLTEKASLHDHAPFYASVGFFETHRVFDEYEAVDDDQVDVPPFLPDTKKVRKDLAKFEGSLQSLDQAVGRIVQRLKDTGLYENTLLIYTTDHGIAFPRAKGTLYDEGLGTALIMCWPKMFKRTLVIKELLSNVDLMPTLLDLVGVNVDFKLDGKSFLPLIQNKGHYTSREDIYCELTWHDLYHPMRGIRTKQYKYIRNFENGPKVYLPCDIYQSLSGEEVREEFSAPNVQEELYDLRSDPLEQNNLYEHENHQDILIELRLRVEKWMLETNDPLLKGPVSGKEAPVWKVIRECQ
jgi:N-sulfoglucosamine sulfohydrolase